MGSSSKILTLNGSRQEMAIAGAADLGLTDASFTVEVWARLEPPATGWQFVLGTDEATDGRGLHLGFRGGAPYFGFYNDDLAGKTRLDPGVWYHVAFVYDRAARTQSIYLNGALDAQRSEAGPFLGTDVVYLGRAFRDQFFSGALRELRIWSTARTGPELAGTLFTALSGGEPGLTGLWPLDEGEGEVARDLRRPTLVARLSGVTWSAQHAGSSTDATAFPTVPPTWGRSTIQRPTLGEQSRIEVADDPALRLTGDQTLELWIRPMAAAKPTTLLMKAYAAEGALGLRDRALTYAWGVKDGNRGNPGIDFQEVSGGRILSRRWTHVAAVRDLSIAKRITLYVDGEPVAAAPAQFEKAGESVLPLLIGGGQASFEGEIAEVRVWRRALSREALRQGASSAVPTDASGLVGCWPLTGATGEAAPSVAGAAHPIRLQGAAWREGRDPLAGRGADDEGPGEPRSPAASPALRFDGPDAVVVPPAPALNPTGPMTLEAWVRPSPRRGAPLYMSPVVSRHGPATGWELRCDGERASFVYTLDGTHQEVGFDHLLGERWLHLAGVYDGTRVSLFVNGVRRDEREVQGVPSLFPGELSLGRNPVWLERQFQGLIAEVRLWGVARTAAELQKTMTARLAGDEAGLLGYWPCDGLEHGALRDASPGGHPGTLIGTELVASDLPLPGRGTTPAVSEASDEDHALRRERDQLRVRTQAQAEQLARLQAQVDATTARYTAVAAERDQLARQVRGLETELETLKKQLEQVRESRDSLEQMLVEGGAQVSLQELIKRSNDEVTRAREALEARGGAYRLGRVSLELKMVPGAGGVGLSFPTVEELARLGNTSLSTLNVDFDPKSQGEQAAVVKRTVPDVTGVTEAMARRKLAEAGYVVEVNYQAVVASGGLNQVDRVVMQLPAKGTGLAPGSTVVLFIGKQS